MLQGDLVGDAILNYRLVEQMMMREIFAESAELFSETVHESLETG